LHNSILRKPEDSQRICMMSFVYLTEQEPKRLVVVQPYEEIDFSLFIPNATVRELPVDRVDRPILGIEVARQDSKEIIEAAHLVVIH